MLEINISKISLSRNSWPVWPFFKLSCFHKSGEFSGNSLLFAAHFKEQTIPGLVEWSPYLFRRQNLERYHIPTEVCAISVLQRLPWNLNLLLLLNTDVGFTGLTCLRRRRCSKTDLFPPLVYSISPRRTSDCRHSPRIRRSQKHVRTTNTDVTV